MTLSATKMKGYPSNQSIRRKKEVSDNSGNLIGDLFDAISDGNHKHVNRVLEEASHPEMLLSKKDPQGLTPLKKAIVLSKSEIARLLVAKGANPSVRDPLGRTALHTAVTMGRRELLAPLLVSKDSNVNEQDNAGWTPLHLAIRGNHLKIIEWLLYAGADVNLKNKNDESPMDMTEGNTLIFRMLKGHNLDRELYPVVLSSAYISKKSLNYVGSDGLLIFLTSNNWSPSEQFFFCKRIRPSEANPPIPLRWNELYNSDIYHYRTMRRLNPGQTRVKVYILYFEECKRSELVLKVTSKTQFLGEMPLARSTYTQAGCTNYIGTCEMEIQHEGQFVMVKRTVSLQLRKNEVGVLTHPKYPEFLIDVPSGALPGPPKDWNNGRLDRAIKERDNLVELAANITHAHSKVDFWQEFHEKTFSTEKATIPEANSVSTAKQSNSQSLPNKTAVSSQSVKVSENELRISAEQGSKMLSTASTSMIEEEEEIILEPMLETYQEDECDDFYYISKGWGLYITVMYSFPLPELMNVLGKESKDKDKDIPINAASEFFYLNHTSDQSARSDCIVQIPKSENFDRVGTVLVFQRQIVAPSAEAPDPDDSLQEYLLANDMKNTWGAHWLNQEKERWSLISSGISNKITRVIFKTRPMTAYIVIQLTSGNEKSEKEDDDEEEESDEKEEEEEEHGEEGEGGEGNEKAASDTPEEPELKVTNSRRKSRLLSFGAKKTANMDIRFGEGELCVPDGADSEEEEEEGGEGEGEEGEGGAARAEQSATTGLVAPGTAEENEDPGAPAPSPMVGKEDGTKDDNANNPNMLRDTAPSNNNSNSNNNNRDNIISAGISQRAASQNRNNNQIVDNDEAFDQSALAPEERTIIVGLPPMPTSFITLDEPASVFRLSSRLNETEDNAEGVENSQDGTVSTAERKMSAMPPKGRAQSMITQQEAVSEKSKSHMEVEVESDEELPNLDSKRYSIAQMKNGVKKLTEFKFGPKLTSLPLPGVDLDAVKLGIAYMWRYRNHRRATVLLFTKPRGDGSFDMVLDVTQSKELYVRAEGHHSAGYNLVGESIELPIKTGRLLSFTIEGPLIVESCVGGNSSGNNRSRSLYYSHSQINCIHFVVRKPQVEETKTTGQKKGKKKEEVKVGTDPDAKLEVMAMNAGSGTNGVDMASMPIWITGPDLWQERHIALRQSDDGLLRPLTECLSKSRLLARNWWRFLILLGYPEKEVEAQKGKMALPEIIGKYVLRWFDDNLNAYDRGILRVISCLNTLGLDVAMDNVVRIIKLYKAHLLLEPVRPRFQKLLFHWVLQTKITRNNLLRLPEPQILRPVSDIFLLHLSELLPQEHLFKIGAAMDVEDNVLHTISGEGIIKDEAYLGFRVLIKSRQKKDEIIHYTLLLMQMCQHVELVEAKEFIVKETKKWMETVADTDPEVCSKLENVFG